MEIVGRTPLTYPRCASDTDTVLLQLPRLLLHFPCIKIRINSLSHIAILLEEIKLVTSPPQRVANELAPPFLEILNFAHLTPNVLTESCGLIHDVARTI